MTIVGPLAAKALRGAAMPTAITRELPIGTLQHDGYFVLRTPLLPVSAWQANEDSPHASATEVSAGYIRNRDEALQCLRNLFLRNDVREALFVASPSLHERLHGWDGTIASENSRKLALSLARYASRLCTRATPFGLFAGVSTGSITSQASRLHGDLADATAFRRHTRLDTAAVHALAEHIGKRPELRSALRYTSNASGHRLGERWRYVEWETAATGRRYKLSAVDCSPHLDHVLELAGSSACSFDALCDALCQLDNDIELTDAEAFVEELIAARVIVADLEPPISGEEPLPSLLRSMTALDGASDSRSILVDVMTRLQALDARGATNDVLAYCEIEALLHDLCPEIDRKQLFQVDLYKELNELRLNDDVVSTILEAARLYMAIGAQRNTSLDGFCQRFAERYKERRVPLLLALDDDAGIGSGRVTAAPSGLLKDIGLGTQGARPAAAWSAFDTLLLERCLNAAHAGVDCIELTDEEIALLLPNKPVNTPGSLSVMLTLAAADSAALDRGEFRVHIHSLGGPCAGNLLGRFCFGSAQLTANLARSLEREQAADPEVIYAEIIHLPQERVGNVICRPLLRDYEITCLGRSGAAADQQIPLSDIEIEVRGQDIALWSRRLRKRIVPRLTTAHNFSSDNLGIYQFLCQLQYYGTSGFQLAWNSSFQQLRRLPRVTYRNIVLLPARWRVLSKERKELVAGKAAERFAAAQSLRLQLDMPRYVGIREGDNVLWLDFLNPLAVDNFADMLTSRGELLLTELASVPGQLCVEGLQGGYAHEIVLPIRHLPKAEESGSRRAAASTSYRRAAMAAVARSAPHAERIATPGGTWLFVKLYCGVAAVDEVLLDSLAPLLAQWRLAGTIDSWFFLRYADPGWHLRLRVKGDPDVLWRHCLPQIRSIAEAAIHAGAMSAMTIDTYEREIERYGGPSGMALSERLFAVDSQIVVECLRLARTSGDTDARWLLCSLAVDRLLEDLCLDLAARGDLLRHMAVEFSHEFGLGKPQHVQFGAKFRIHARRIGSLLRGNVDAWPWLATAQRMICGSAPERQAIARELRAAEACGELWCSVAQLVPSYVHMVTNRFFIEDGRAHELVLYDLLRRGYDALLAQGVSR